MIRIEFPSENTRLAGLIGRALVDYAGGMVQQLELPLESAEVAARNAAAVIGAVCEAITAQDAEAIAETPQEVAPDEQAIAVTPGLDRHGVAFNPDFCANAADPFYNTGPREGQWKKRRGLDDAAYDAWHASQRAPAAPVATEFDAGAAFGAPAAEPVASDAPTDGAGFMVWVSEMLAAGRLKQADINDAWQALRLTPQDIFPPKGPEDVQRNVANLYNALAGA